MTNKDPHPPGPPTPGQPNNRQLRPVQRTEPDRATRSARRPEGEDASEGQPQRFADVLSSMPVLWARLIAEHVPDPTGRRCRACTTAGTGTPGAAWPCGIRDAADGARRRWAHATAATPTTDAPSRASR